MAHNENPPLDFGGPHDRAWKDFGNFPSPEAALVGAAIALGAERLLPWSVAESALVRGLQGNARVGRSSAALLRNLINEGLDPLGEAFCAMRSSADRRLSGATYTPNNIVGAMVGWAATRSAPGRIIDPGTGSARFLMRAGRDFPAAMLVGIEADPFAALLARANLAALGFAGRSRIFVGDYRTFSEPFNGATLYIGNPPYVRHHHIESGWKEWLFEEAARLGHKASRLAGLHVHFYLATARAARPGDFGTFITASEWLDVNYGSVVRSLMLEQLGGLSITVIEPTARPFSDALTTAAIATFDVGSRPTSLLFRRVGDLRALNGLDTGRRVHRDRLAAQQRWSYLTSVPSKPPEGFVELGELCRVHRGQVTGSNGVWIAGSHSEGLPRSVLFPAVTRAREIFAARGVLDDPTKLRCVIDLPVDLGVLDSLERNAVNLFLKRAREMGANRGYIASHRRAWWAVELKPPAPIISTYMARRPPAFVVNKAAARHINIAHGLYPRVPLSDRAQFALVRYLQGHISQRSGRTYGGGLTKFEPREMERLIVPAPELLEGGNGQ